MLHFLDQEGGPVPMETAVEPQVTPQVETQPPVNDDPYKLFEGVEGDAAFTKALDIRRQPGKYKPEELKAAYDVLTNRTIQARLGRVEKKYEGRKYGDKDLESKLAEARSQWEKEHPQKDVDPERQAYLESLDPQQRADVEKILELQDKRYSKTEKELREELAKIKEPIDTAVKNAQENERNERVQEQCDAILEKVSHVDPFTILDVVKKNESLPENERMEVEEMITLINEIEDERFKHLLPARLIAKDAPTISLLKSTVSDAVKKNEPWAMEMVTEFIDSYEEVKRGTPSLDTGGSPKPTAPQAPKKWDPYEAMREQLKF